MSIFYQESLYENSLLDLIVPEYISSIGDYAFNKSPSLTGLSFYPSLKDIGQYAIRHCNIQKIHVLGDSGRYSYESKIQALERISCAVPLDMNAVSSAAAEISSMTPPSQEVFSSQMLESECPSHEVVSVMQCDYKRDRYIVNGPEMVSSEVYYIYQLAPSVVGMNKLKELINNWEPDAVSRGLIRIIHGFTETDIPLNDPIKGSDLFRICGIDIDKTINCFLNTLNPYNGPELITLHEVNGQLADVNGEPSTYEYLEKLLKDKSSKFITDMFSGIVNGGKLLMEQTAWELNQQHRQKHWYVDPAIKMFSDSAHSTLCQVIEELSSQVIDEFSFGLQLVDWKVKTEVTADCLDRLFSHTHYECEYCHEDQSIEDLPVQYEEESCQKSSQHQFLNYEKNKNSFESNFITEQVCISVDEHWYGNKPVYAFRKIQTDYTNTIKEATYCDGGVIEETEIKHVSCDAVSSITNELSILNEQYKNEYYCHMENQ